MRYIQTLLTAITLSVFMIGCTENEPVTTKLETVTTSQYNIFFTKVELIRYDNRKIHYIINNLSGEHYVFGPSTCLTTFDIEFGKTYTINLRKVNDTVELPKDLCTLTATLKNTTEVKPP